MKTCYRCKIDKDSSCFGRAASSRDGLHWWCRQCFADHHKRARDANPEKFRERSRLRRGPCYKKRQEFINHKKSIPCADCGVMYKPWVMQFDHLVGTDKKFNLSRGRFRTYRKIKMEIEKCEVVCANCHAERTHKRTITI